MPMEDNTPDSGNGEFRRLVRVCARHRVSLFFAGVLYATPSDGGDVGCSSRVNALERALECPRCRALNDLDAPTPAGPVVYPTTSTILSGNTPCSAPRAATDHREFGMIPPAAYRSARPGSRTPEDRHRLCLSRGCRPRHPVGHCRGRHVLLQERRGGRIRGSATRFSTPTSRSATAPDIVSVDNYDLIVVVCTNRTRRVYATFTLPQETGPAPVVVISAAATHATRIRRQAPDDSDLDQYIHPPVCAGTKTIVCTVADARADHRDAEERRPLTHHANQFPACSALRSPPSLGHSHRFAALAKLPLPHRCNGGEVAVSLGTQ